MELKIKMAVALLSFGLFIAIPAYAGHGDDEEYEQSKASKEFEEYMHNEQARVNAELRELKAKTQVNYNSRVDTTSPGQSYFEDTSPPPVTVKKSVKKSYKYKEGGGANVPRRIFNNVQ